MNFNFFACIQGGEGEDVWDKELPISAVDFEDAFKQAVGRAEELHGHVVSLEQNDWDKEGVIQKLNVQIATMLAVLQFVVAKDDEARDELRRMELDCDESETTKMMRDAITKSPSFAREFLAKHKGMLAVIKDVLESSNTITEACAKLEKAIDPVPFVK